MTEPKWISIARTYIGVKEGPGAADNPIVVAMYAKAGHPEVKHDAVPWCAAFVGAILRAANIKSTDTLWALDYAKWGQALKGPVVGAVATKKRDGGGHVAFVVGYDANAVYLLGGNQGDAVCIAKYPRAVINSYRWPSEAPIPANPPAAVAVAKAGTAGSEA